MAHNEAQYGKPFRKVYASDTSQRSRLMSLSAELRNRIYEFAFQGHINRTVYTLRSRPVARSNSVQDVTRGESKAKPPGLILSCKQIHEEALGIFYSTASFLFEDMHLLRHWAETIGDCRKRLVRYVLMTGLNRPCNVQFHPKCTEQICRSVGFDACIQVWNETVPFYDPVIKVTFKLWSKSPVDDAKAWVLYLKLREEQSSIDLIPTPVTTNLGATKPTLPSWLVPVHAALMKDAGWSSKTVKFFWATTREADRNSKREQKIFGLEGETTRWRTKGSVTYWKGRRI
jgi:hypothetical protein